MGSPFCPQPSHTLLVVEMYCGPGTQRLPASESVSQTSGLGHDEKTPDYTLS